MLNYYNILRVVELSKIRAFSLRTDNLLSLSLARLEAIFVEVIDQV